MLFILTNALSIFQRFVNDIFANLLDVYVLVYLDDILIFSNNMADHKKHVKEVLWCLWEHGLFVNGDECCFHSDSVEYLGYIIGSGGLRMDSAKVQDWPKPKKVKDVQSFLGFANFYRHFFHGYSEIVLPLTHLTWKTTPWNFDNNCRFAFQTLKNAFITAPVLTHWKPGHSLIVETDASDYAFTGILSMQDDDSEICPIVFLSRTFSGAELNYDVHDKELLAIYEAFRSWHHYLEGASFQIDVVTDHKHLEYFATTKLLSRRQARWSEYLSAFNMVIRFRPRRPGRNLITY